MGEWETMKEQRDDHDDDDDMRIWGMRHPTTRDEKNPKMRMERKASEQLFIFLYRNIKI